MSNFRLITERFFFDLCVFSELAPSSPPPALYVLAIELDQANCDELSGLQVDQTLSLFYCFDEFFNGYRRHADYLDGSAGA
jgi:hypothetical protein